MRRTQLNFGHKHSGLTISTIVDVFVGSLRVYRLSPILFSSSNVKKAKSKTSNAENKCNKIEVKFNLIIWRTFPSLLSFARNRIFHFILFLESRVRRYFPIVNYRFSLDGIFIANNQFCRCLVLRPFKTFDVEINARDREGEREREIASEKG